MSLEFAFVKHLFSISIFSDQTAMCENGLYRALSTDTSVTLNKIDMPHVPDANLHFAQGKCHVTNARVLYPELIYLFDATRMNKKFLEKCRYCITLYCTVQRCSFQLARYGTISFCVNKQLRMLQPLLGIR